MTNTTYEYGLEYVAREQHRLNEVAEWAHIQDLHDKTIAANLEFNAALKKYRDAYPRSE